MKPKTMILMVVAVTCGLGASYMTSQLLAERGQPEAAPAPTDNKVTVLVAKKSLSPGTVFKSPEDDFGPKQFEKGQEPANALTEVAQLKGERLKRALRVGDYVSKDDLVDKANSDLGADLPPGMRAVGLPVNQLVAAGGFASLPGSHVDILWTARGSGPNDTFTKVLLENVKILAADTTDRTPEDKKWVIASVITVQLSVQDSLLASIAQDTGKMSFLLRNHSDATPIDVDKVSLADVLKNRKKNEDPDGEGDGMGAGRKGGGGLTDGIPDVTGDKKTDAAPAAPLVEPPLIHKLLIVNGTTPTRAQFELDRKTGGVVSTEVSEPERPQQRPAAQAQPPQAQPQPPQQAPAGQTPPGDRQ